MLRRSGLFLVYLGAGNAWHRPAGDGADHSQSYFHLGRNPSARAPALALCVRNQFVGLSALKLWISNALG